MQLFPSLQAIVESAGLNPEKLILGLPADDQNQVRILDRHTIAITDGDKAAIWEVASLRELFRGNQKPPADMDHYPPAYTPHFFLIESQLMSLCALIGDRTDQEMEEVYSMLRRRPDGRSIGVVHDFMWQTAALLLACHALSEAEYEGLFETLTKSTRKWGLRPVSRFYLEYLHDNFDEDAE